MQAWAFVFTAAIVVGTQLATSEGVHADAVPASTVLAPGQVWFNYRDNSQVKIHSVNTVNSTFAANYGLITSNGGGTRIEEFPLRGQFDPVGITVGWTVSYWNSYENYHSLGSWTGYVKRAPTDGKYELTMTVAIAHEENEDTTTGEGLFILETP